MKKILLLIASLGLFFSGKAQSNHLPPLSSGTDPMFNKFEAQIYTGITRIYCDVNSVNTTSSFGGNIAYRVNNFLSLSFDLQKGLYSGGDRNSEKVYHMEFKNRYITSSFSARLHPFALPGMDTDILNTLYIAAGVGAHFNNVTANSSLMTQVGYLNNNNDANFYIPLEVGVSIPLFTWKSMHGASAVNSLSLFTGYRYNLGFSDTWDGYIPSVTANAHNDGSGSILAGLLFKF